MKRFTLIAATALVSLTAAAQVTVGLQRSHTDLNYDAFTSTDAFVKSADGLAVSFYESDEMAAKRTTENTKELNLHGAEHYVSDFAWNLRCTAGGYRGALGHADDAKFPENFNFGFSVTVPEGKQLAVSDVTFDLLINAWISWRVRIVGAEGTELYNSGNFDKYGSLTGYLSSGSYAHINAEKLDLAYATDPYTGQNAENAADKAEEAMEAGFQLLPADLTLQAGTYTVILDADFINPTEKQLSFDTFTITGTLADAGTANENAVTYALQADETHASGETVGVKLGDEVVATLTFGEEGGAAFNAASADKHVDGYVAYTSGNGENGNKAGGTFYTIVPKYKGKVEVAVVLNSGKKFFVEEDGTALPDYNGITEEVKYYGTYTFDVKAGSSYKVYCAGSKLGFYGFTYVIDGVTDAIQAVSTPKTADGVMYNLRGQRIDAPRRGQLYILNGRKQIAK